MQDALYAYRLTSYRYLLLMHCIFNFLSNGYDYIGRKYDITF